ncbi:hypothetical protein PoHVEF18_003000 [Penicillium ochrochloron]
MALSSITKHFNRTLTLSCTLIALSQLNYGFDNQAFSTTQSMTAFTKQFGEYNPKTKQYAIPAYFLSLLNSLNYIGFAVDVYIGFELSVVPVYQSEIVPAPVRGFIVGTYQLSINSPRWLLLQERVEEAEKSLKRLRHGTVTDDAIAAELTSLQVGLAIEPEKGAFKELFQGVNLKRTAIVIVISFFQQATGQAFASQYGAIFIKSLGTINIYNFTIITSCIGALVCLCSNFFNDKIGRRKLFIVGGVVQVAALLTMGGLGTAHPVTRQESTAIASMVAIFGVGFGLGWGPLTYVVVTELPALSLRDHSQRVSFLTNIAVNFAVTFSIPYLLDDQYAGLHSRVGFIFGSIAVCACVFVYFYVPDCQGKSLEEVDRLFHEGAPVRKFRDYDLPPLDISPTDKKELEKEHEPMEKV